MAVLRIDIIRALDELVSQEDGMRFQGLAVVLGKKRWPELIARERKKDRGLDAYVPASETPEKLDKGLAASITPKLKKISGDAQVAKEEFPDLKMFLFVTPAKVGNADQKKWTETIYNEHSLQLLIIEREEIITQLMMPENSSLCASFLNLNIDVEPQIAELIDKTRRAADAVTQTWVNKIKGHPLINLTAVRLNPNGAESKDFFSLIQIDQALSQSRRIILEGPAGRGKTTTLIQLAQHARTAVIAIIVDLPHWTLSHCGILEYISGMSDFQTESLTAADIARVQLSVPFLLLLNGWNEISESNAYQASHALRVLERDFPNSGIIVATRTHHLTPPLPGALRLRLLRLQPLQRTNYLNARLGAKSGAKLRARIDVDPALDELTRTPFILSEVVSLFEAGTEIPSTKIGVLSKVQLLQEQRDEHKNALQSVPIFGCQTDYLKRLAIEMTRLGAVALPEADCRTVVAAVAQKLVDSGQIEPVGAPAILATLTAHHVIERLDYPGTTFRFEHQQFQEYYTAIALREQLLDLRTDDPNAIFRIKTDYLNNPVWAEPLYMLAETFAEQTGDGETEKRNTRAGCKLVEMALAVDLIFAGELVKLCGAAVWNEVRTVIGKRFRDLYATSDGNYRQYALTAMLATGSIDFKDIVVPLLSGQDQQIRLHTYRLWPDINFAQLGSSWRELVYSWSEDARIDFVSEMLHHRVNDEIVAFAVEDDSIAVKQAAATGLMWIRSEDALIRILESMDAATFDNFACKNADRIPITFRSNTVAAMRKSIESTSNHTTRLRTALDLIRFGEAGLDDIVKDAMGALPSGEIRNLDTYHIKPALEYLHKSDPVWVSEWVASQIADGVLYGDEYWLPFATAIPSGIVDKYLHRIETENLENTHYAGMIKVITTGADAKLSAQVFKKLRDLQKEVEVKPVQRHEFERQVMYQLEAVFRSFADDIATEGILLSVTNGDTLDIKVTTDLLSRVARTHEEPLQITAGDLKARLRAYLKNCVSFVHLLDDFNGEIKANLASSIAQVGKPEDMIDLVTLIRADIERMRRVNAAFMAGDRDSKVNAGRTSYTRWHIEALMQLDSVGAEQVLVDLLAEPEYLADAAEAMACDFLPKSDRLLNRIVRYDLMWAAREGHVLQHNFNQKRTQFSTALNTEIKRLREQNQDGKLIANLKSLAKALAAIDGAGSVALLLDIVDIPSQWDHYTNPEIVERMVMAGGVLPSTTVFALVDTILERTDKWMQDPDTYLLLKILTLCPFVDDPSAGISKIREVLGKRRLWRHELSGLITALGESRTDAATDLLYELASNFQTFQQCENKLINAFATLDMPRAREFLLSFIDPDIRGIALTRHLHHEDVLIARLSELAQRRQEVLKRLLALCDYDLPESNREILSKVMNQLNTPEALKANLSLIDDTKRVQIPRGIWDQFENAFVERRPYGQNTNFATIHGRASNELRDQLFKMAIEDKKRQKSAFRLLGQIEEWRQEHGRPTGEPRHPNLASGQFWPPN